jgi:trehalose synthase
VFSRDRYVWDGLDSDRVAIVPPSIDAFSPKNQPMDPDAVTAILARAGVIADGGTKSPEATFTRRDGTRGSVEGSAEMFEDERLDPGAPVVVQVSRWDRLKDPVGVLRGFADHVASPTDAHLVLAGPSTASADDPEGAEVLDECRGAREGLTGDVRRRVHLAAIPTDDDEENAAIVNALQRHATIVVQKSLAEGFGLTVAEAMWKERAVVASRIGGIQDQIEPGESGVLLDDPHDLGAFGEAVTALLRDGERRAVMGKQAMERIRNDFLGPRHLIQYLNLISRLIDDR